MRGPQPDYCCIASLPACSILSEAPSCRQAAYCSAPSAASHASRHGFCCTASEGGSGAPSPARRAAEAPYSLAAHMVFYRAPIAGKTFQRHNLPQRSTHLLEESKRLLEVPAGRKVVALVQRHCASTVQRSCYSSGILTAASSSKQTLQQLAAHLYLQTACFFCRGEPFVPLWVPIRK